MTFPKTVAYTDPLQELIALFQSYNEAKLQRDIVEPLLRAKGFREVRDNSGGPLEKGKDLVALLPEPFGKSALYAVQIKRQEYSARRASKVGIGHLFSQLRQALREDTIDPSTGERRRPDRCLLISPYPIDLHVLESATSEYAELRSLGLTVVDGYQLVEECMHHLPKVVDLLSLQTRYLVKFSNETERLPEARIALELTREVRLSDIYVEVSVLGGTEHVRNLFKLKAPPRTLLSIATAIELQELGAYIARDGVDTCVWNPPRSELHKKSRIAQFRKQAGVKSNSTHSIVEVDTDKLLTSKQQQAQSALEELRTALNAPKTVDLHAMDSALATLRKIGDEFARLRGLAVLTHLQLPPWDQPTNPDEGKLQTLFPSISPQHLLGIFRPIFVTGEPGVGKTTLLRTLGTLAAGSNEGPMPVLVSLTEVATPNIDGLLKTIKSQLSRLGVELAIESVAARVQNGSLLMLLDGLDEMGSEGNEMLVNLDRLLGEWASARIVLSCRSTYAINWSRAFAVEVPRFSLKEVSSFIDKWFVLSPKRGADLKKSLGRNKRFAESVRTPLYTALMCAIFDAHGEIPRTEIDLYNKRIDLLLGKWEVAKGIQPLSETSRSWMKHLLMSFAFWLHSHEKRFFTRNEFELASRGYRYAPALAVEAELVRRGIIQEYEGLFSFGHLTFQEHLAALWLAHRKEVESVLAVLGKSWWNKVLELYASEKGDITLLLERARLSSSIGHPERVQLSRLARLAPLTLIDEARLAEEMASEARNAAVGLT